MIFVATACAPQTAVTPSASPVVEVLPSEEVSPFILPETSEEMPLQEPGEAVTVNPALPKGEEAYIKAAYTQEMKQYKMFADEIKKQDILGNLVLVVEIDAYNKSTNEWLGVKEGSYNFTIPFEFAKTKEK